MSKNKNKKQKQNQKQKQKRKRKQKIIIIKGPICPACGPVSSCADGVKNGLET